MSKKRTKRRPPPDLDPDYTGAWNRERWFDLLRPLGLTKTVRGVEQIDGEAAARWYSERRRERSPDAPDFYGRTVRRWASLGADWQDPTRAAGGSRPALLDIAEAHGVEPSWLLGEP